ncbi:hypothetical protein [Saccharopolyspora gloriosae]|uniref:hypothetical protein n=1 Tax=Saccharopolyspora gloriosae TaxID=455344 RepID=UPI001FB5BC92|nr:hypothetical protein [Saccharopolyspora gloriosae]
MEELDTEIKGDPESFTATCQWLRDTSANIEQAEQDYLRAGGGSETGWAGAAGDAFRDVAFQGARMAGDTVQMVSEVCSAMEIHADGLRTARAQMQHARDAATDGGLKINGFKIQPPGDAPPEPAPLPSDGSATQQQTQHHNASVAAAADYQRKIKAYREAAETVAQAKKTETDSQNVIVRSVAGVVDPVKLSLTLGDVSTGLAGAVTANSSKWKAIADSVKSAELPGKLAQNTSMSAAGRFQAAQLAAERSTAKATALAEAYPTRIAAAMDKLPDRAKTFLDLKLAPAHTPTSTNALLRGSTKLAQKLPFIGLGFTAAGVGYDISQGKDATQAAVSGGASFVSGAVSGAAIGAAFGGPVGVIGGAIIGIGVGIAVDEGWNLFD